MTAKRRTGYVFEEIYLWHDPGSISFSLWVQPGEAWENKDTKSRFHSLVAVSGMLDKLTRIRARKATKQEILRFHTESYHDRIEKESKTAGGGDGGELARFAEGGYDIALLSAGGLLAAVEALVQGQIDNAYCLIRPPGHHAVADKGMGFCIFNNIALAALHARSLNVGIQRVAIVDYDVHHGNGTQEAFWNDPNVLFVSIHQDSNYPQGMGTMTENGGPGAEGTTVNVPLPPGSGTGAYYYTFDNVVIPALHKFKPDLILVSSGFDASYADPLGSMMMSSEGFSTISQKMITAAEELCHGRIVFAHEGGYSKDYVPFCGLAVIEALAGVKSGVVDPYLEEVKRWGYQDCQPHQAAVVDAVAAMLHLDDSNNAGSTTTAAASDTAAVGASFSTQEKALLSAIRGVLSGISDPARRAALLQEALLQQGDGQKLK